MYIGMYSQQYALHVCILTWWGKKNSSWPLNRKNDDKPMDVLVPYFRTKPCRDTRNQNRDGHAENMWLVVTVWLPCESSRLYFLTSLGSPGFQAPYSNVMGQISPSDDFLGKNWKMSPSSDDFPPETSIYRACSSDVWITRGHSAAWSFCPFRGHIGWWLPLSAYATESPIYKTHEWCPLVI